MRFTHQWGGPLAIARDWAASVGLDRRTGLGWAGGYVGDGVSTTNLAGRTLADLVTGTDTDLVDAPLGQPPQPPLGARAAALAGHQRRPAGDDPGRRRGAPHPAARAGSPALMAPLTGGPLTAGHRPTSRTPPRRPPAGIVRRTGRLREVARDQG